MRASLLAESLVARGHSVTWLAADFSHQTKSHRGMAGRVHTIAERTSLTTIESMGYNKNVSLRRLVDHFQVGIGAGQAASQLGPFDVGFIGFPPIEPAWVLARLLVKIRVPFMVDVKDLWPDVFVRGLPSRIRPLVSPFLSAYRRAAHSTLRSATALTAPTDEMLDWALQSSGRSRSVSDIVSPLTSTFPQLSLFEVQESKTYWLQQGYGRSERPLFSFVGSINSSNTFSAVLEASQRIAADFVIAGSGSMYEYWRTRGLGLTNVHFPGWISQAQSAALHELSTAILCPIRSEFDFVMSIPNKFFDAMMFGRPVVSDLAGCASHLIQSERIGWVYPQDSATHLVGTLETVLRDPVETRERGTRARKLFEEKYQASHVYNQLAESIEALVQVSP